MSTADPAPAAPRAPWPKLDPCLMQTAGRPVLPPFPLAVIAASWRPWIEGHAQSATCADYFVQGLLAAVSAVCGSRVVVDVTPHWREPLVLWQALVGAPSTGKTAALVAARRLLAAVRAPADPPVVEAKPPPGEPRLTPWLVARGISSWSVDLDVGLAAVSRDHQERVHLVGAWTGDPSHSADGPLEVGRHDLRFPESIFGTFQAGRLAETLVAVDGALLSRLLYCWPEPRQEARLEGADAGSGRAPALLQRLVDLPGTIAAPAALALQGPARRHLQELMTGLRAPVGDGESLEAAWAGKGAGTIVRLAGLLRLMDWAEGRDEAPCTAVELRHVERAQALWAGYFRPHAQAVFGHASGTLAERRVRRVGRWLRLTRPQTVSREEVRREALCQAVDADTAGRVIEQLERQGAVRMLPVPAEARRGPRKLRWEVNPLLWAN